MCADITKLMQCNWIKAQKLSNFVQIGRGSYSTVYSFDDPADGKTKALKVLARATGENVTDFKNRFDHELITMKTLKACPQILSYEDHFFDLENNLIFIITEKAEMNLNELVLKKGRLDPVLLTNLLDTLLKGLLFAHKKEIVHRDLKPENILLTSSQQFLIADWGIARQMEGYGTMKQSFTSEGTDEYLPPEILNSEEIKNFDVNLFKADIFSCGLIILFCCGLTKLKLQKSLDKCNKKYFTEQLNDHINIYMSENYPLYKEIILKMCAFEPKERCDILELDALLSNINKRAQILLNRIKGEKGIKDIKIDCSWFTGINYMKVFWKDIQNICLFIDPTDKHPKSLILFERNGDPMMEWQKTISDVGNKFEFFRKNLNKPHFLNLFDLKMGLNNEILGIIAEPPFENLEQYLKIDDIENKVIMPLNDIQLLELIVCLREVLDSASKFNIHHRNLTSSIIYLMSDCKMKVGGWMEFSCVGKNFEEFYTKNGFSPPELKIMIDIYLSNPENDFQIDKFGIDLEKTDIHNSGMILMQACGIHLSKFKKFEKEDMLEDRDKEIEIFLNLSLTEGVKKELIPIIKGMTLTNKNKRWGIQQFTSEVDNLLKKYK